MYMQVMLVLRRFKPAAADDADPRMRIVRPALGKDCAPLRANAVRDRASKYVKLDDGAAEDVWSREFEVCLPPVLATHQHACSRCTVLTLDDICCTPHLGAVEA
jgi:hypothetical protein